MGRFSTLQKSPVAWPTSRFLQTNLRGCLSVRQLYLPSATKRRTSWHHTQQLEMRQPGKKKGFSPTWTGQNSREEKQRSVGREMHLIRFFFWKILVQQLESVVKCPVLWVVFLMKIAFLSLAKITEILSVTKKMACVAVQHLSSINHHHPMILLDGLGLQVAWNPHVSVDSDLSLILFCLIVLVLLRSNHQATECYIRI